MTWTVDRSVSLPMPTPEGTVAFPIVQQRAGVEIMDRRRRRRVHRALVTAAQAVEGYRLDADRSWVLATPVRRATSIAARYSNGAEVAVRLCMSGVVDLVYDVTPDLRLGGLREWRLTARWIEAAANGSADSRRAKEAQAAEAIQAAAAVRSLSPELAAALGRTPPGEVTSPLAALAKAAMDLIEGRVHDGPRAFSQHHFHDGKVRDDIPRLLSDNGVPVDVADALGVRRSQRIGIAGPVVVEAAGVAPLDLRGWDGPVLFRADQPGLSVTPVKAGLTLVVVENAQAAEWAADQHSGAIVIYSAGPPGTTALGVITQCATGATRTFIVCDADLGGVRISALIRAAIPSAEVVDIGDWPHTPGAKVDPGGVTDVGLRRARDGLAASLAEAVLARGYRVEQEQPTTAALRDLLQESNGESAG